MKQLNLEFELEASNPPPVALEQNIQAELVARLAEAINAVHQREQEKTHEGTSSAS
jgi:hypothetical protein